MTPFHSRTRDGQPVGTFVIDRRFRGVGRIRRASGTSDVKLLKRLHLMLDTLYEAGRLDILVELRDGRLTALQVWQHFRLGDWSKVPTSDHARPLADSLEAYRTTVSARYSTELKSRFKALLALGRPGATVADLPGMLERYRVVCEERDTAVTFNRARSAAQAFVRTTLGKGRRHPLWLELAAIAPLRTTPKLDKNPQTRESAQVIREALGGEAGRIWWVLCCTGMGPDEYFGGKWAIEDGRLHVKGTKRRARDRYLPLLVVPHVGRLTRWGFSTALRRAGLSVTPYDARRTFANWCERAGLIESDIDALIGHGPKTMTQLYTWHRMEAFLDEVEAKLRAFLGGEFTPTPTGAPK